MCKQPLDEPKVALENALIEEYLHVQGYSPEKLRHLPKRLLQRVMKEAIQYAALKLEEIEDKARLVHEIHAG